MSEHIEESFAKINLSLDVLSKRPDGYHEINTIMQQIDLKDKLIFKPKDKGITIESNDTRVPLDSSNLVYKVWDRLREITGIDKGIHVRIEKNIPIAAGLAGGSGNGAATLKAVNKLWDLNLSEDELMKIGSEIGADIPFCVMGGTAQAKGIGEKLTPLKPFSGKYILLANPDIEVSTAYAYSKIDLNNDKRIDIDRLIDYMQKEKLSDLGGYMSNCMEEAIISMHPIIDKVKSIMVENGALGSLMSGSGPTVFGLYDDEEKMNFTKVKLENIINRIFICKTI